MSRELGRKILRAQMEVNPIVNSVDGTRMFDPGMVDEEFNDQTCDLLGAMGKAIQTASSEEYREIRIYDGTQKRSDPTEIHLDHYIPEENFHSGSPDYSPYKRNKEDSTDVVIWDINLIPPEISESRNGYRLIIKDSLVNKQSVIRYSLEALDKDLENDLPDEYEHTSPGSTYIINKDAGEWQLFFERKGAYYLRYGVWNDARNVDSAPRLIPLSDAVPL
jgi:hypothetical protein